MDNQNYVLDDKRGKGWSDPYEAMQWYRAQLDALEAGWQPIETAPKDKWILVWDEVTGLNCSYFTSGVDCNSDEQRDGWFSPERDTRDERMVLEGPVTHWMPQPGRPSTA